MQVFKLVLEGDHQQVVYIVVQVLPTMQMVKPIVSILLLLVLEHTR